MNKLIINVYVPASGNKYEMRIPSSVQMYKVLELIKKAITSSEEGRYTPDDTAVLCIRSSGNMINLNLTAEEAGLQNGSNLMLI